MHYPIRITYERSNFVYFRPSFLIQYAKNHHSHMQKKTYPKLLRQLEKPKISRSRGLKRSLHTMGTEPLYGLERLKSLWGEIDDVCF